MIFKKRRLSTGVEHTAEARREGAAVDGHLCPDEAVARGPRVHLAAKPLSSESAQACATQPTVSPEVAPPRRRRVRDPLRRPGEVRIVVQTPVAPQAGFDDTPVWQRLLSWPAEEVSYRHVRRALEDLQATVIAARLASKIRIL